MKETAMGRTDKVIRNGLWGTATYIIMVLVGMYCQRVFILELGYKLYGLNAMFVTVVSTLGVSELGIGTAIVFSLYKPLAEQNERKIGALVALYRKVYSIVGGIVFAGSAVVLPFMPGLTGFQINEILLPYCIFILNAVLSYSFTFNQTVLSADQKNYIVSVTSCVVRVIYNLIQIVVIYQTHNFALYTLTNLVCVLSGNIILNHLVARQYPFLRKYKNVKLSKQEIGLIKKKVVALIYHKIGGYLVSGGDNFILSGFLGVATVGYYTNYTFITNTLKSLILSIFTGFMSGFGNLIATDNTNHNMKVFEKARFVYFSLYIITAVGFFCSAEPFLESLYTDETVLPHAVLWLIVLNYFVYGYSASYGDYRAAAGVFEPDRYLSIIIPIVNVGISIALVRPLGVAGVLIGTFICYAIKECTVVPFICSKFVFHCSPWRFWGRLWFDVALAMLGCFVAQFLCSLITLEPIIVKFLVNGVIGVCVAVGIIIIIYGRSEAFHFIIQTLQKKIKMKRGGGA